MTEKQRILIIDANPAAAQVYSLILQRLGQFETDVSHSSGEGIAKAVQAQPDLIILDMMLPGMDGWESCKLLRGMPETQHIPIIIYSEQASLEYKLAGFEAGTLDYIVKPIAPQELVARVKAALNRPSASKSILADSSLASISSLSSHSLGASKTAKPLIFISYRRTDSEDITGRICDHLFSHFGAENVFRDVHSIPYGVDFREYLNDILMNCKVLLAVIGQQWLSTKNEATGERRIDEPTDFVRLELEVALQRGISVIPLLVQRTSMPQESQLPFSLKSLSYRNAISIKPDPDFHSDMARLMPTLESIVRQ